VPLGFHYPHEGSNIAFVDVQHGEGRSAYGHGEAWLAREELFAVELFAPREAPQGQLLAFAMRSFFWAVPLMNLRDVSEHTSSFGAPAILPWSSLAGARRTVSTWIGTAAAVLRFCRTLIIALFTSS